MNRCWNHEVLQSDSLHRAQTLGTSGYSQCGETQHWGSAQGSVSDWAGGRRLWVQNQDQIIIDQIRSDQIKVGGWGKKKQLDINLTLISSLSPRCLLVDLIIIAATLEQQKYCRSIVRVRPGEDAWEPWWTLFPHRRDANTLTTTNRLLAVSSGKQMHNGLSFLGAKLSPESGPNFWV